MDDKNFMIVEEKVTKKNYILAILFFVVALVCLFLSYLGPHFKIDYHFVIPGTSISFGWLALLFAGSSLFKPFIKETIVKKQVSAIHHAIANKNIQLLKKALDNGADIQIIDPVTQNPPLLHAAHTGNTDIINLLLDRGAPLNSVGHFDGVYQGANALFITVLQRDFKNASLLLKKGIDINHQIEDGGTVLLSAVNRLASDVVSFLIENGADPNIQDKAGNTASIVAARLRSKKILKIFIDKGINIDQENRRGETPLRVAIRNIDIDLFTFLTKNGLKNVGRKLRIPNGFTVIS
ncbi:ankyrin repeat domain-containing protein [candidate division KSB1 bacterium]|nr:ankyrin repeat domain-containing protein [candidate division KSB1 bacterium]